MTAVQTQPRLRPGGAADVPDCLIADAPPGAAVVLAIPGTPHEASDMAGSLSAHPAFARATIIVPLADHASDLGPDHAAAAAALARLLESLTREHDGMTGPLCLFGFGDGARTAQELAMRAPRRTARLCLASAGWFAMPLADLPPPYGIRGEVKAALLDIPATVVVGLRDTRVDAAVPQDALILAHQGRNRLRRARCYVRAAAACAEAHGIASRTALVTQHGISPDFAQSVRNGGLIEIAAQALL